MIREWEGWVKDAMHEVGAPEPGRLSGENQILVTEGKEYSHYVDGFYLMASKVWSDIQNYDKGVNYDFDTTSRKVHRPIPHLR